MLTFFNLKKYFYVGQLLKLKKLECVKQINSFRFLKTTFANRLVQAFLLYFHLIINIKLYLCFSQT